MNAVSTPISPAVPPYSQTEPMGKPPQLQQPQTVAQNQSQNQPSSPSEPVQPAFTPPPAPTELTPSETQSVEPKSVSPTLAPTSPNARSHDHLREKSKRGLYVSHAGSTSDEVKRHFPPEDSTKIVEVVERYTQKGNSLYWYVYFATPEIKNEVLARLPESLKSGFDKGKPIISEINLDFPMNNRFGGSMRDSQRPGMGDSKWSRGGDPASISRGGPGQARAGGPGGSASEGEGQYRGGGRGNFRGGSRGDSRGRVSRGRGRSGMREDGQGQAA